MSQNHQLCTFYLDGLFFGVEVQHVHEVICNQRLTRVPLASPVVRGLINLRGEIVMALDLRRQLQLSERAADQVPMNVVVCTDEGPISLLVDAIGDVVTVDAQAFERLPDTVTGIARELVRGAYKLNDQLLLLLDTEKAARVGEYALN